MTGIREQATLTSKGQLTLPKAIRQALGVTTCPSPFFGMTPVLPVNPFNA